MKTKQLYMTDSYLQTVEATVVEISAEKESYVILDQTIFYAQGGGQPTDRGIIKGGNGTFTVSHVSYNAGAIQHKGNLSGNIQVGDKVTLEIDWQYRYENMQKHTAGHIVDQAVKNLLPEANSVDGNHGIGKKMYIEFTTAIPSEKTAEIEREANEIRAKKLEIKTEMVSYEQLVEKKIKLPFDLPQNKDLRIVQIGEYPAMPDGGTQLKNTGECEPISIPQIIEKDGKYRVIYQVSHQNTLQKSQTQKANNESPTTNHASLMTIEELQQKISDTKTQLEADLQLPAKELHIKYLGKKGLFNDLAKLIKDVDDKKAAGEQLNELKKHIENTIHQSLITNHQSLEWQDLTVPGLKPKVGHMHPISQAIEEISDIFDHIGFTLVRYPEVDWDWYAFESLNMPPDHPARDEWETFFVDAPDTTKDVKYDESNPRKRHPSLVGGKILLTPQTSNGQVREMERLNSTPPIRMINIARCYRRQQDVTHTQMFHQFEGLVVDRGINIQHLKGTLDYFAAAFYGPGTKSRIRPFHFQFTEPSFEVDFSCHICGGTGYLPQQGGERQAIKHDEERVETTGSFGSILADSQDFAQDDTRSEKLSARVKCRFCKSGWHEVGGAGMVHPNVLKAGGIDPEVYTGFAFGWGVERTYTLKEGLNIDDIRLLYSGDLRFLHQF